MEGKIVKAFGRYYTVRTGNQYINSVLRGKTRQDPRLRDYSEPAAVGDLVDLSINAEGLGVIEKIYERKNVYTRKDRGRSREDLIAANIDQLVIVQAFRRPDCNPRFVDRLLVRAEKEGLSAVLCLNKADLMESEDLPVIQKYYEASGLKIIPVSAETGMNTDRLKDILRGKISMFAGYSGVGKSSLLNRLFPGMELVTSAVSDSTKKGRHTTTNVHLLYPEEGFQVIDTPGVREFGLLDISCEELSEYFPEMREYAGMCRFLPCTHEHEPGCAVKAAVENGSISAGRYESYLNILFSIKNAPEIYR